MLNYIAVIHKEKKSEYGVSFPDVPGCITSGKSLEEAKELAEEALSFHLSEMEKDGESLPKASELDDIEIDEEFKNSIHAYLVIEYKPERMKAVRVNITLDENLLSKADRRAEDLHLSRSGLISYLLTREVADDNLNR